MTIASRWNGLLALWSALWIWTDKSQHRWKYAAAIAHLRRVPVSLRHFVYIVLSQCMTINLLSRNRKQIFKCLLGKTKECGSTICGTWMLLYLNVPAFCDVIVYIWMRRCNWLKTRWRIPIYTNIWNLDSLFPASMLSPSKALNQ